MAHKPRLLPLLVLAIASVSLVGCGDSGGGQSAAQLVARATPICEGTNAKREAANASLGHATSLKSQTVLASIAKTAPGLAEYDSAAVAQLRKLQAPSSLALDWTSMLADLQQLAEDTARLGKYASEKNIKGAESLLSGSRGTRKQLVTLATHVGLTPCARAN
jgi:hypothetical protein